MIAFKKFLESHNHLADLAVEIAISKEFALDIDDASKFLRWLKDESPYLTGGMHDAIHHVFGSALDNIDRNDIDEYIRTKTVNLLRKKYKVAIDWHI